MALRINPASVPSGPLDAMALYRFVSNGGQLAERDRERWEVLAAAVMETVSKYAPDAPRQLRNESMIRLAGWLADAQFVTKDVTGPVEREHVERTGAAFRRSGAMSLLSPYRARRAL